MAKKQKPIVKKLESVPTTNDAIEVDHGHQIIAIVDEQLGHTHFLTVRTYLVLDGKPTVSVKGWKSKFPGDDYLFRRTWFAVCGKHSGFRAFAKRYFNSKKRLKFYLGGYSFFGWIVSVEWTGDSSLKVEYLRSSEMSTEYIHMTNRSNNG